VIIVWTALIVCERVTLKHLAAFFYVAGKHLKKKSQMPRHLISDAHEWINEIPTVPIY